MDSDEITISQLKKKKSQPVSIIKKLRSKIPRRKRFQISPILGKSSFKFFCGDRKPELSVFPVFSSSSCFPDEIDSSSNLISVGSDNVKKLRSARRKKLVEVGRIGTSSRNFRSSDQLKKIPGEECRRLTRSFYRKNETEISSEKGNLEYRPELSESSCVESCSGAVVRTHCINDELSERKLSLKSRARKVVEEAGENEGNEASAAISISETSCIQPISQKKAKRNLRSDKISGKTSTKKAKRSSEVQGQKASEICVIKPAVEANDQNLDQIVGDSSEIIAAKEENRAPEASFSEISRNYVESNVKILNSESTADKKPNDCEFEYALSCSEQFSFEEGSDYSTIPQTTVSELESDIFSGLPEIEFSDYSPSILIESSSSDFSEVSAGNSTPTAYFSFFIQYSKQLSKLNALPDIKDSSDVQEEFTNEFTLLKFEDEIDEDSYNKFRSRERREVILRDYVEDYYTSTAYGDLILRQRLLMVNWIVEQSSARELNYETMFLGVSLFDRFLSKGFFKNKRKLQLVGIACLTLATRIEENQPTNCVRQRTFHVGVNVYSRCEVVAMEWLVQEVLNFQCFLPTSYNFLWFYLKAARAEEKVEERAKYLAMLSLLDHERLCYWPSTVAAGLVILSALVANQDSSCQRVMETHVRTKDDDLPECIRSLEWLVKYVS